VVMKLPEIGNNYLIIVRRDGALDKLIVQVEVGPGILTDDTRDLYRLKNKIAENIKTSVTINPQIELHEPGILPSQEGKAIRVVDERGVLV